MQIRRAREESLSIINHVVRASKSHWPYPKAYLDDALPLLHIDSSYLVENLCFEIVESELVIGFFAVAEKDGDKYLDHLWISPQRIGHGVGHMCCQYIFSLAKKQGWRELLVLPEPSSDSFYKKQGFQDTGMRVSSRSIHGPMFSLLKKSFSTLGAIQGLSHITLTVRELDRAVEFYSETLGLSILNVYRGKSAYLRSDRLWLVLVEDRKKITQIDYSHVAFLATDENYVEIERRITASGAHQWQENRSPGRSSYFLDPSGNRLELHDGTWRDRIGAISQNQELLKPLSTEPCFPMRR